MAGGFAAAFAPRFVTRILVANEPVNWGESYGYRTNNAGTPILGAATPDRLQGQKISVWDSRPTVNTFFFQIFDAALPSDFFTGLVVTNSATGASQRFLRSASVFIVGPDNVSWQWNGVVANLTVGSYYTIQMN